MIESGSPLDLALEQAYRRRQAEIAQKQRQQGLGKGIISAKIGVRQIVVVGNAIHQSERWRTFHDFLDEYLVQKLGLDWFAAEKSKPEGQRHKIVQWWEDGRAAARLTAVEVDGIFTGPMVGAQRAFLNLAYNIYLIAHHAPQGQSQKLLETFLTRLRSDRNSDFTGKLFETYAAAAFLKAGFEVDYEDESKGGITRVEFVATYPGTGKKFSVEVKSRNHDASDGQPLEDFKYLRVMSRLARALQKKVAHTRVVMIEINVADVLSKASLDGWPGAALDQIKQLEQPDPHNRPPLPPAYVMVTNHAFHNNLTTSAPFQLLADAYRIPDFGARAAYVSFYQYLQAKARHKEISALIESMRTHYEIPSTFDGENPYLAFSGSAIEARLRIGDWHEIPDQDGNLVPARLDNGTVIESEKSAYCIYQTKAGLYLNVYVPLSDAEVGAWKRHPETFFGEIQEVHQPAKTFLDMALFFHRSYKDLPRDVLLKAIREHHNQADVLGMDQPELAAFYAEGMARSVMSARRGKSVTPSSTMAPSQPAGSKGSESQ
jgi:hypothetical protein